MTADHPCNCSTCNHKHKLDDCPMFSSPYYVGIGAYPSLLSDITCRIGCFWHPQAREWLMKPEIEELEREISKASKEITHEFLEQDTYREGIVWMGKKAITLIKNGGGGK